MRRSTALALILLAAGCAPRPEATPQPQPVAQVRPEAPNSLTGLTAQDLVGRFGSPQLQIREGNSVKLQFRSEDCVLDAYLYPSGNTGTLKVIHVDTRGPSGADIPQAACTFSLRNTSS
jgi:hypothetical protein